MFQRQVQAKVGNEITIKISEGVDTFIRIFDSNGHELAWANFYLTNENVVKVLNIRVQPKFQRLGISKLILAKVVDFFPNARGLKTSYIDDNQSELDKYLGAGYSIVDAIKLTPTYKSLAAIGFTDFIEIRYNERDKYLLDFTVSKPFQ
jgi:GNAT superfamily N-acetyltransferase